MCPLAENSVVVTREAEVAKARGMRGVASSLPSDGIGEHVEALTGTIDQVRIVDVIVSIEKTLTVPVVARIPVLDLMLPVFQRLGNLERAGCASAALTRGQVIAVVGPVPLKADVDLVSVAQTGRAPRSFFGPGQRWQQLARAQH